MTRIKMENAKNNLINDMVEYSIPYEIRDTLLFLFERICEREDDYYNYNFGDDEHDQNYYCFTFYDNILYVEKGKIYTYCESEKKFTNGLKKSKTFDKRFYDKYELVYDIFNT